MSDALVPQQSPFSVQLEAGRTWCACGRSRKQPFCDGSHSETSLSPVVFKAERDGTVDLCGCKTTGDRPFCDGSHNQL